MQRVCMEFETFVERMMRTGETSAVLMVHGGTIMSILSAYGLPRAPFYDWMVEPGHGYSLRITPGLWMRSMVAEVYDTIPPREQQQNREHTVIDYAEKRQTVRLVIKKKQNLKMDVVIKYRVVSKTSLYCHVRFL
ncbi:MAG: hypothetical protein ACLR13_00160 [Acutalibacteraceae bacterium]